MSGELENIRQLVAKLDEVQIELNIVKKGLDSNFENYKNINTLSANTAEKNQEVLESINTLQIQATETVETAIEKATNLKTEMSKYYSAENTKIEKDLDTLLSSMKSELSTLKSTIRTTIQSAVNDVNIDTSDLSKVIDDKIANLDTEKIDKFITSLNKYFEQHKNDAKESAKEIKTIRAEIKTDKTELDKELETYYQSREEWINKLKNQNKKYTKAFKTPRGFLAMILLAIFFGLGTGAVITKYLTDKQVIVYKDLDIPKLAQKSGDKDWISAKVLKEEMKNKNTDVNILTFIPWWLILIIAFTFLVIFSPAEEEKKSDW